MATTTNSSSNNEDDGSSPTASKDNLVCEAVLPLEPQTIGSSPTISFIEHQPAWSLDFSPDGTHLAVCYGAPQPCIRIWTHQHQHQWHISATLRGMQTRTIRSVAFAPLHTPLTLAAASFDGTVAIWEQQNNNKEWDCVAQLEGHDNECKHVAWNATGTLLATCGRDKTVWIWESFLTGAIGGRAEGADFECLAVLSGHQGDVKCVAFAPNHDQYGGSDGEEIAISGSYDHTIRIWAEDAGDWYCAAVIDTVHAATVWSLTVAPSGRRFVSASADNSLAIHQCFTGDDMKKRSNEDEAEKNKKKWKPKWECVGKLTDAHDSVIYAVDYAPVRAGHGRVVSTGGDGTIRVYREALGCSSDAPLFSVDASAVSGDGGDINCVKWHPWEGNLLASAEDSGNVRIWKYTTA